MIFKNRRNTMVKSAELEGPVVVQPLSPEASDSGNKRFMAWMERSLSTKKTLGEKLLMFYWGEGKLLEELVSNPGHYGNQTVSRYAEIQKISPESAQYYRRFFRSFSEEQARSLVDKDINWRDTCYLLSVHDETARSGLIMQLEKKEITSTQLEVAVKKINKTIRSTRKAAGDKVDGRGGAKLKNVLKGLVSSSGEMERKLDSFKECHADFLKMPLSEDKSQRAIQLKEVFKSLASLEKKIGAALKLREKNK